MLISVLGVDPGLTGAIAFLNDNGGLTIWDMPILEIVKGKKKRKELNMHKLGAILDDLRPLVLVAYVEDVHSLPKNGVVASFSFGWVCGAIRQALVDREFMIEPVQPRKWQTALKVKKGGGGSLLRASELMPQHADKWSRKMDHNRAAATLIAHYGIKQISKPTVKPARRRLKALG